MRLNKLTLTNIGAFHGDYVFDLTTNNKEQNVILFGGKNGSGKTTILESIRLALFGPLSFGYKTDTSNYYERIDVKLNSIAKRSENPRFKIELEMEVVENFKRSIYTIRRKWEPTKKSLKEILTIKCNGKLLSDRDTEIFQTRLRENTPPQLMEFCLFDGEQIAQIISEETLSSYLREAATVVFNLDLFQSLEEDLNKVIKQDTVYGSLSSEEKNLHEVTTLKDELLQKEKFLHSEIARINSTLEDEVALLNDTKRQYEVHGGLVKEQRDQLVSEMNQIENDRRVMMEQNKETLSTIFPFLLIEPLAKRTVDQMRNESVQEVHNNVKRMISSNDVKSLLEKLQNNRLLESKVSLSTIADHLYNDVLDLLASEATSTIHNASFQQRAAMEKLYSDIQGFNRSEFLGTYKKNAESLEKAKEIRRLIEESDNASDLHDLLKKIQSFDRNIIFLNSEKVKLEEELSALEKDIEKKELEYSALKEKVLQANKAENVFVITNKVLEVSRAFRALQLRKKLTHVEIETAQMLQKIFRKELFVVRVSIDAETFELKLFNPANEEIKKEILSAGEKQILLLSTVWAMVMCSKRRIPFVFDTLLGRLDQTHKKSIIQNLVPRCGDQVIILSTDSEINSELYQEISPYVSNNYTIDFDTNKSTVRVSNNYFTYSSQEGTSNELSTQSL